MPEPNIYGPQKLSGPFADALDPNIASAPHQSNQPFSGYEGTAGKLMGVASRFLAGLGQGRMIAALSKEREKSQKVERYMAWGQSVLNDPNLTPEARAQFQQDWQKGLLTETAGAIKQNKDKHPLIGAMGKIVEGLAGGEVKASKYDLKAMDEVFTKYAGFGTDPKNTMTGQRGMLLSQYQQVANKVAESLPPEQRTKESIAAGIQKAAPDMMARFDSLGIDQKKAQDSILEGFIHQPEPAKPPTAGSVDEARVNATKRLDTSKQPQPPTPGVTVMAPQPLGPPVTVDVPGFQPPPPNTQVPRITPEAREYLRVYNLDTPPKEMMVNGKKMQVAYTVGGNGIDPGFFDPQTGKYITGNITVPRTERAPQYKIAEDKKKTYGGGEYYVNMETGKPLKDANGDVVRPREQQSTVNQRSISAEVDRAYATYTSGLQSLDKEAEAHIASLQREKDAIGNPKYNPDQLEAQKKNIYDDIKKRKGFLKDQTEMRMKAVGAMYGVPAQPFMSQEQQDDFADTGDDSPLGGDKDWSFGN